MNVHTLNNIFSQNIRIEREILNDLHCLLDLSIHLSIQPNALHKAVT